MGKRVPEHIVKDMKTQKRTSMFLPANVSYKPPNLPTGFHYPPGCGYTEDCGSGYRININNILIEPYYTAYKKWLGTTYPISDGERLFFEADMIYNVFRTEFELSPIYSKLDLNRAAEILLADKAKYQSWVQYRTELFGEKKEAG